MTRINVVPPKELTDLHLLAEYRELPRIFGLVTKAQARGESPNDPRNPPEYTLGTGHIRFFYNKLAWCVDRYLTLVSELQRRGFRPQYVTPHVDRSMFDPAWFGNWRVTRKALAMNRARIAERLRS